MVGKIPGIHSLPSPNHQPHPLTHTGLLDLQAGPGLAVSAHRAKGYDMGLVATLEKVDDIGPYGTHPAHLE